MTSNYVEILVRARDQGAKPEMDDLRVKLNDLSGKVAEARALVDDEAAAAKLDDLQAKLLRLDKTTARPKITMDQAVRAESQLHSLEAAFTDFGNKADDAAKKAGKGLDDVEKKAKAGGQQAAAGLSPLLLGAFAAAATAGPGLILAATSAAVLGAGALVVKGNVQLQESYKKLAADASQTVMQATAPLVPAFQSSLQILDQGILKAQPQLKGLFAAAVPEATQLATGVSELADNSLPGMVTALRAAAPYGGILAADLGKLGTGVSDLFTGLATGAKGGAVGLDALITTVEHLLGDVGQITGSLSNGLGPSLHDVETVAVPVAGALTDVVKALPPASVRTAADALALLFAAFKVGKITGIVSEGTGFLQFLGMAKTQAAATTTEVAALGAAETAAAEKTGLMGMAAGAAFGPIGFVAGAVALSGAQSSLATGNFAKFNQTLAQTVDQQKQAKAAAVQAAAAQQQQSVVVTKQAQAMDGLSATMMSQVGIAGDQAKSQASAALATAGLTDGTSTLTTGLYNVMQAYSAATTGASGYNTILTALNGTQATLDDAQNSMAQDLLNLKTSFKANGVQMGLNTQQGISNRQALSSAAQAAVAVATAQFQANGNMGQANKTLQQQEQAIIKATGATGKARDAVKAYLDQIMKIPDNVTTNVNANVSPALAAVHNAVRQMDNQRAYVQVYATMNNPAGGHQLLATGGISGGIGAAATGGPRGNLTWVGEQGPELIPLPPGTPVRSHSDSMRTAAEAGGGGWDGTVRLVWDGPAGTDGLFQLIRQHVRAVAGTGPDSVQTALGQH